MVCFKKDSRQAGMTIQKAVIIEFPLFPVFKIYIRILQQGMASVFFRNKGIPDRPFDRDVRVIPGYSGRQSARILLCIYRGHRPYRSARENHEQSLPAHRA